MLVWFRRQGYAESTIGNYLTAAGPLFRWLRKRRGPALRGLSQRDLTAAHDYFRKRRVDVTTASRAFARFLAEYRLISVERPEPPSRSERQLQLFGAYLHEVRGLAPASVIGQQVRLRPFLQFLKLDQRPFAIHRLKPDQIEAFLRQSSKTNNRFSLQHIVSSLRAFLRHQHAQGVLREPLYQRIDTARTYRLEQLPRALPWEQVTALLRSIDRSAPGALRDFTVLYLAVRYGLRSSELVHLTLDDIDWRAGTLKVTQTKTRQTLLLPLTNEAGDILARYLRDGRPRSEHRELFLRRVAPSGPLAPTAVHAILDKHRKAFGSLKLPVMGSHVLRHSLAVHLLRRGVRLPAIGAALGHRVPGSTAIYLRLATEDLREVGLPVPKGGKAAAMPEGNGWRGKLVPARASPRARAFRAGFHSELAASIRLYLETRRALGRAYVNEEYALRHWDNFLVRRNAKVRKATPEMFHAWAGTMPTLTPTVRRQRMLTVRNFLLFHARRRPSTAIPELSTFPRRGACQPPRLVSIKEMARILATAASLPPSHRNLLRAETIRLALVLLFCCGLRRGELLRLRRRDFDPREDVVRIDATKFHKSRLVPLPRSVANEVRHYLAIRRRKGRMAEPDAPLLWRNNPIASHKTYCGTALTENWNLLCIATGVLDARGRPPRLHDLRHSFAVAAVSHWYQQGADVHNKLPYLATYLGHVSPTSTHYYLHLSSELSHAASRRFRQYVHPIFEPGDIP
jgi:integrase